MEKREGVATRNEPKAPTRNYRNRTVRFQELDDLVLSGPTAIRGIVGLRQCNSPPAKRRLNVEET
jgi:hypothetical protein